MLVIYDGQCPFCTSYFKLVRLREAVGTVELLDARQDGVAEAVWDELGLDLNEGILAVYGRRPITAPRHEPLVVAAAPGS